MACLRSAPEAHIICYISRDNPRCGAISNYLLYTGVRLSLFFLLRFVQLRPVVTVNISSSREHVIAPNPVIFRGRTIVIRHSPSFFSLLAFPLEKSRFSTGIRSNREQQLGKVVD